MGNAALNALYRNCKRGAERRNLVFELGCDDYEYIISLNCIYCGEQPKEVVKSYYCGKYGSLKVYKVMANGIDRVDNSQGYTVENCEPCCYRCNSMKSNLSENEFLQHAAKIVAYRGLK